MGSIGNICGFGWGGAEFFAETFGVGFGLGAELEGIVTGVEVIGALLGAVLLQGFELEGKPAEGCEAAVIFIGIRGSEFGGLGREEELGQFGGRSLEADFGNVGGVVAAEEFDEVVLMQLDLEGVFLGEAPFAVAAAGFPVGNVAGGNAYAESVEGSYDLVVGDVVEEHAIDEIAMGLRESGDLAIAGTANLVTNGYHR